MRNTTKPRTVSFEDALRNLASRLTGTPVASLPRTQEGIVQYMADHLPDPAALAEDITKEVLARIAQDAPAGSEPPADGQDNAEASTDTQAANDGSEATAEADSGKAAAKRTRKPKTIE